MKILLLVLLSTLLISCDIKAPTNPVPKLWTIKVMDNRMKIDTITYQGFEHDRFNINHYNVFDYLENQRNEVIKQDAISFKVLN